jgi:hypothetical protein
LVTQQLLCRESLIELEAEVRIKVVTHPALELTSPRGCE